MIVKHPIHLLSAFMLAALTIPPAAAQTIAPASEWTIGPVIRGKNYSVGMPLSPRPQRNGWSFDFPNPTVDAGHVHYVTFPHGPLAGKSEIIMRYRIDAARGVRFVPQEQPQMTAKLSLYFQRRSDTWTAKGKYQYYRWYSPGSSMRVIAPGTYEVRVKLDDPEWIPVMGGTAGRNPPAFIDAKRNADTLGIVFGSDVGRGHGVYSTGAARFTLLSFQVI